MTDKRSHPTPRAEGMDNLVRATIRLLKTTSPADLTLRDIALEAGHGHRMILEWFGGKGGLYVAVFEKIFDDLAQSGELFYAGIATHPDVRTAIHVFNYMQMHHMDIINDVKSNFVLTRVNNRFTTLLGLTPERAQLAARRLVMLIMGIAIFSDFLDFTDEEITQMTQDEFFATTGLRIRATPLDIPPSVQ